MKILVVDDALSTLTAMAELLSNAGFDVVTASDFAEARRMIDQESPDLLLLDVRLGAYNGLQLAIRERLAHPQRPVIIITGFPDATVEAEARRCGAEFIEKPIRAADLLATIHRLLATHTIASSNEPARN